MTEVWTLLKRLQYQRRKVCYKRNEKGHIARFYNSNRYCFECKKERHQTASMSCGAYRNLVSQMRIAVETKESAIQNRTEDQWKTGQSPKMKTKFMQISCGRSRNSRDIVDVPWKKHRSHFNKRTDGAGWMTDTRQEATIKITSTSIKICKIGRRDRI